MQNLLIKAALAACLLVSCNTVQNATADTTASATSSPEAQATEQSKNTSNSTADTKENTSNNTTDTKENTGKEVQVRELEEIATSQIQEARQEVIKDEASFAKLWKEHSGVETGMPKVDFEKEMILAVFMGEKNTGGYRIQITKAELTGKDLQVEVTETSPDPSSFTIQIITAPSHLVAVEKVEGKVEFKTKKVVTKAE